MPSNSRNEAINCFVCNTWQECYLLPWPKEQAKDEELDAMTAQLAASKPTEESRKVAAERDAAREAARGELGAGGGLPYTNPPYTCSTFFSGLSTP